SPDRRRVIMKEKLLGAIVAVLGLGLGGQVGMYYSQQPTTTLHASWAFHPATLAQARDHSQSIVLAQVVSVERGQDLVTAVPNEPNGVDRIPTQRITVRVLRTYKGTARVGQQVTLFQTGGTVLPAPPPPGGRATTKVPQYVLEGDPLYVAGEQYLLMLE